MAAIKYTAGRLVLFVVFFLAMWPIDLDIFIKLIVALLLSAIASFFLLRTWRNDMAEYLAGRADSRKADREKLRAALAGDDDDTAPATADAATVKAEADAAPGEKAS